MPKMRPPAAQNCHIDIKYYDSWTHLIVELQTQDSGLVPPNPDVKVVLDVLLELKSHVTVIKSRAQKHFGCLPENRMGRHPKHP